MTLDNRATDGEADAHAVILCSVERLEDPVRRLGVETDPCVPHAQAHALTFVSLGSYQWHVKETGRDYASDFVHIFTIRDGKIAGFREHFDSAVVAAAYQQAMSA